MQSVHSPPPPPGLGDVPRWEEGRRRRRLLRGLWAPDLEQRLRAHFGVIRRSVMGPKTMAKNIFRKLCKELAVNYTQAPAVRHPVAGELPELLGREGWLERIRLWSFMRRVQQDLIGMREVLLRIDWSAEDKCPVIREVFSDTVVARARESNPRVPVEIRELRWRQLSTGGTWAWDVASIEGPEPFFKILVSNADGSDGEDLTAQIVGRTLVGEDYPYRYARGAEAGRPFLPYVLYHALPSDTLWDPFEGVEVVDATLDVAAAYTFLQHTIFRASWPQRWALGAFVAGTVPRMTAAGPRSDIPADPTSIVHFEPMEGVQNAQIGQFGPGCEPESLGRAVGNLDQAVANFDGIEETALVRDTANPWSAAALTITGAGKRLAQAQYAPELAHADKEMLGKLASLINAATGSALPEDGYLVEYPPLPLSADEAANRASFADKQIAAGRMSIVDAWMLEHPGHTRVEAVAHLKRIQAENQALGVRPGTAPTPIVIDQPQDSQEDKTDGQN